MIKKLVKTGSKTINMKTHTHPLVKQNASKFSNPNVLYSASGKAYKSKTSGAGWGGEKLASSKKK